MSQIDPTADSSELEGNGNGSSRALATIDTNLQTMPALGWSYGPPARPEILSAKPNPVELLHAVRRRWPLAIGLGILVGLVASGLVWYFLPIRYEAFALLRVSDKPPSVLNKTSEAGETFAIFKRTQIQLVLSGPVLRSTVREAAVSRLETIREYFEDPVSWLQGELILEYPDDAEVLRIAIKGERPAELITIVNTVVRNYLTEAVQKERERRLAAEARVEKQYADYTEEFTKQTEALHTLEQLNKVSSTEAARVKKRIHEEALFEAILLRNNIMREIHQTDVDMAMLKARKDEPDTSLVPDALVEAELNKDPTVYAIQKELGDYKTALAQHIDAAADPTSSPTVAQINRAIMSLENQLDEYKAARRPQIVDMLAAKEQMDSDPMQRTVTVGMLEKKLTHLEEKLKEAQVAIEEEAKAFDDLQQVSGSVSTKQEDLAALRKIMTDLRTELDRIQVERLAQERITKLDDAQLASPDGDAMRKYVGVAFAGVLGFAVVVVGVGFLEFQSRKLNDTQQVTDGLGIRVIGELPSATGRTWRRIKGGKGPAVLKALMAERIDGARTALIHSSAVDPPRVVMVTSADPREGKTTTSSQLAASLARSGRRTLLIDADVRNPGVHRVFDMPLEPGLCELLRGEAERDAVIHTTRTANLWLMPAGHCDLRSVQALATSFLGTAISSLCTQFDFVVIDSGPVLKVADSLLVGQHIDAAILSVQRDVSKICHVYEACERLRSVGITVLGTVVNGVNDDAARHGVELLMSETT